MRKALGRYVGVDPTVCHGQPTFRGTRILVTDVLDQVASGMAWEAIIEEWRGALTKEAIAEAVCHSASRPIGRYVRKGLGTLERRRESVTKGNPH